MRWIIPPGLRIYRSHACLVTPICHFGFLLERFRVIRDDAAAPRKAARNTPMNSTTRISTNETAEVLEVAKFH